MIPCQEELTRVIIEAARLVRKIKGMPEEKNISVLYREMAPLLGVIVVPKNSKMANHLPRPEEMKDEKGTFIIPNKPCPVCGKITFLISICPACCKDSENGKYKSGYVCDERNGGCGFIDEKGIEFISERLSNMGVEFPTGMKEDLGILTLTDEGLK